MKKEKLQANIWKIYVIKALGNAMVIMPILVLFFQDNGLSVGQIFLLQAIFSISILVLEIPSGYFSDVFGRKQTIVFGSILAAFGFLIYSFSYGFWGFLAAELILGIGASFISGSDSALLYDSLLEMKKEEDYRKVEGRNYGIAMFSESVGSILGGLLAVISLRTPLYVETGIYLLVLPVVFSLIEPPRKTMAKGENAFRNILKIVKHSLHDHVEIKWLMIYSSVASASTLTMVWFIQLYLVETGVPVALFGIVWAGLLFIAAFISWNADKAENFLGRRNSLASLIVFPVSGYFLLSTFWFIWSGIFLILFYIARGINNPIISNHINGLVSSDMRATILSTKNLVGRVIFSIVGPAVGWISDIYFLKAALMTSGFTFLFLGLISLGFMKKHKLL